MKLTDIMIDIQQRETGAPLAAEVVVELRELAVEYSVEDNPRWLLPVFMAVQQGHAVSAPVFFEFENSDPYSYLFEIADLLHWKSEFVGEYDVIEFPRLGWHIYISHEASSPITGRGGSTYQIMPLSSS